MYQYTMERKLINEVKKYKCLYSKNSLDYKNKAKRSQAWSKISSAMKINGMFLQGGGGMRQVRSYCLLLFVEKICQTKWKYIRDRYVRICNRNAMTGADASESHWLPQKHLHFLKDHISSRRFVNLNIFSGTN